MKQISTKEIVDLFAYNKDSAVLVEKRPLPGNAQYKVNYSVVNFATGEQEVITKRSVPRSPTLFSATRRCSMTGGCW